MVLGPVPLVVLLVLDDLAVSVAACCVEPQARPVLWEDVLELLLREVAAGVGLVDLA